MRQLPALLLAGAILLTACTPKQTPPKEGQKILDPKTKLYINVSDQAMRETPDITDDPDTLLSPREIVKQAIEFCFDTPTIDKPDRGISIGDFMKDIENARLVMGGDYIITDKLSKENGDYKLDPYFLELSNVRILAPLRHPDDKEQPIIAYIPNETMRKAEKSIKQAYAEGRYDDVYREFQELYTAIPTTTARWKALRAEGKQ